MNSFKFVKKADINITGEEINFKKDINSFDTN